MPAALLLGALSQPRTHGGAGGPLPFLSTLWAGGPHKSCPPLLEWVLELSAAEMSCASLGNAAQCCSLLESYGGAGGGGDPLKALASPAVQNWPSDSVYATVLQTCLPICMAYSEQLLPSQTQQSRRNLSLPLTQRSPSPPPPPPLHSGHCGFLLSESSHFLDWVCCPWSPRPPCPAPTAPPPWAVLAQGGPPVLSLAGPPRGPELPALVRTGGRDSGRGYPPGPGRTTAGWTALWRPRRAGAHA